VDAWQRIEEAQLQVAGVTAGTGFGRSVGLRISGKVYALLTPDSALVLKLPKERVDTLVESGAGERWGPGTKRVMKEWVAVPVAEAESWPELVEEARRYVASASEAE
jgi:hypothetical protein